MKLTLTTASELGKALRLTRKSLGKTQQDMATLMGHRRQAIGDLEAGRNVSLYTLMDYLNALGKGLQITDFRPEPGELEALLDE